MEEKGTLLHCWQECNLARGLGCSGYNTLNVEVSKYDGEAIPEDVEIPQTILFE